MSQCLLCRGKARKKELERPYNVYCSSACQFIQYHLYDDTQLSAETIADIRQKIIRDVAMKDLWRICSANRMMAGICSNKEFQKTYYKTHKDEVEEFVKQKLVDKDGNPDLHSWIALILEQNPSYQTVNVLLYAAQWGLMDVLKMYGSKLMLIHQFMVLEQAIAFDQRQVLNWLQQTYGFFTTWSQRTIEIARRYNKLELLEYLKDMGYIKK